MKDHKYHSKKLEVTHHFQLKNKSIVSVSKLNRRIPSDYLNYKFIIEVLGKYYFVSIVGYNRRDRIIEVKYSNNLKKEFYLDEIQCIYVAAVLQSLLF